MAMHGPTEADGGSHTTLRAVERGLWFLPAAAMPAACAALVGRRWLVVPATSVAVSPGGLGGALDDAVEGALALRGALPPDVEVNAPAAQSIRDRVLRVRMLDRAGLAVAMPRMEGLAGGDGRLDRDDGEVLRAWIEAAKEMPVVLLVDERDRGVELMAPVPLVALLGRPAVEARVEAAAQVARVEAMAQVEAEATADGAAALEATSPGEVEASSGAAPSDDVSSADESEGERERERDDEELELAAAIVGADEHGHRQRREQAVAHESESESEHSQELAQQAREPAVAHVGGRSVGEEFDLAGALAEVKPEEAAPPPPVRRRMAERVVDAAQWRAFAVELDSARGPKPVRGIETLFVTRYLPLLGAAARGEVDAAVRGVIEAWRTSFEHSYREAFAALRVTGKRPTMVFDAPDVAGRVARLNGARSVKLLLVDAMSFDLGERVRARLTERLAGVAVCVQQDLLWSALPTTTPTQLALLGRGADGLRDPAPTSEREPDVARGRSIGTLRRERIGSREIMKLDVVEARMRTAGPPFEDRFDLLAEEIAQIVARFADTLPPRTLLYVFGDHGFRVPVAPDQRATGPATQGGASPEEVLVPGQAWLVGGVH